MARLASAAHDLRFPRPAAAVLTPGGLERRLHLLLAVNRSTAEEGARSRQPVTVDALVLTCEHGGNRVPARYRRRFESLSARAALDSHRGLDLGALGLARALRGALGAELIGSSVTRLLVDLNRSPSHPRLFSEFMRGLSSAERSAALDEYYVPHRQRVERAIAEHVKAGRCTLHVAVHSFTPRWDGKIRGADVGLLYDPHRALERDFSADWKLAMSNIDGSLRVRRNYPYRGTSDGLTTHLRDVFTASLYLGIELETNQALLTDDIRRPAVTRALVSSLATVLGTRSKTNGPGIE